MFKPIEKVRKKEQITIAVPYYKCDKMAKIGQLNFEVAIMLMIHQTNVGSYHDAKKGIRINLNPMSLRLILSPVFFY